MLGPGIQRGGDPRAHINGDADVKAMQGCPGGGRNTLAQAVAEAALSLVRGLLKVEKEKTAKPERYRSVHT